LVTLSLSLDKQKGTNPGVEPSCGIAW
jgi:hypothetical protein